MTKRKIELKETTGKYSKEQILSSSKYSGTKDLLSILLDGSSEYTTDDVDAIIDKFMKGQVR